jgi:circadian clock protein KaiC
MTRETSIARVQSGVKNLDALFNGGLPRGSAVIVSGPPGSGKTILTQQICFHNASEKSPVLYFNTLSEPTAKTLRYLKQFSFFDPKKLGRHVHFVDLGVILRGEGLGDACSLIMERVKKVKPSIVVIDSFKVFDDLAKSTAEFRKFSYDLAVKLMAWEATVFLLGEYAPRELEENPLLSIVDGLCVLSQREASGEQQRFFRAVKMRGTGHTREEHAFVINRNGVEMFAPRLTIQRESEREGASTEPVARCKTGNSKLDEILGPGIPRGSSLLVSGVAGTGKTVLSLEFLYRGALAGEKGIYFSFEETEDRLLAAARGLGWDIDRQLASGMIEIVFIPQPEIMVEAHLLMMSERIQKMGAKRVVIDSVSVFLHKVEDAQQAREKIFHLCTIVQNAQAVGWFPTDIPYGSSKISRYGVEETVVDGVLVLSASEEGLERQRYIEVYKLRNTAHLKGRHNLVIDEDGVTVFPRYGDDPRADEPPPALSLGSRLGSGVPGLDALLGGGLLERSATVVSGSAGIGKSTLGLQFLVEGAREGQPGLYVTLEEGPAQLVATADALGLPLRAALDAGTVEIFPIGRGGVRAGQLLSVLADRLKALAARRVVLDSVTHLLTEDVPRGELEQLLHRLVVRFKMLDVTSVLTLEARSLVATDEVTERGLSPVSDNLLMMRYAMERERLGPKLIVVKTRGSEHDRGVHSVCIGEGGLRVGGAGAQRRPAKKRSSKRKGKGAS